MTDRFAPAFPCPPTRPDGSGYAPGMTFLDYVATAALQGILAAQAQGKSNLTYGTARSMQLAEGYAAQAVQIANALIAELAKQQRTTPAPAEPVPGAGSSDRLSEPGA